MIDRVALGERWTQTGGGMAGYPVGLGWRAGRAPMTAPGVTVEGYTPVLATEISLDSLTGATVYGANQENIGAISDVVLNASGEAEYAIIDVGGFLGLGSRPVAIGFDEMTILRDAGWDNLQVHVAATRDTLEDMPPHQREG